MFRIRTFGRHQNLGAGANIGGHDVHDADSGTKTAVCFQGDHTLETHGAADELTRRARVQTSRIGDPNLPADFNRVRPRFTGHERILSDGLGRGGGKLVLTDLFNLENMWIFAAKL